VCQKSAPVTRELMKGYQMSEAGLKSGQDTDLKEEKPSQIMSARRVLPQHLSGHVDECAWLALLREGELKRDWGRVLSLEAFNGTQS
jgi:hypothetical protein